MALVVGCGATAALADGPRRAAPPTAPASAGSTENLRVSEPTFFDFAVPDARGGGMTIYRFNRAEKRLAQLEHLDRGDVAKRTRGFNRMQDPHEGIIVLSPEGQKKPPPPPPPGDGDKVKWKVPQPELQVAMEQLKTQAHNPTEISIGQLAPAQASAH